MQALVFNGPRDIRYESYADPELRSANSAILKVESCSICGSDLHMYHGAHIGNTEYSADSPKFCCGADRTQFLCNHQRMSHECVTRSMQRYWHEC